MSRLQGDNYRKQLNNDICLIGKEIAEDILQPKEEHFIETNNYIDGLKVKTLAKGFMILMEKCEEQNKLISSQREMIQEYHKMLMFYSEIIPYEGGICLGTMEGILFDMGIDIDEFNFEEWLKSEGLFENDDTPHKTYVDMGLFKVNEKVLFGETVYSETLITDKGQNYIIEQLKVMFDCIDIFQQRGGSELEYR